MQFGVVLLGNLLLHLPASHAFVASLHSVPFVNGESHDFVGLEEGEKLK